jgi:tetratricopeptide (TPR) repeat protein
MQSPASADFLDVPRLLDASQPAPRQSWTWYILGVFALIVLTSTWASSKNPQLQLLVRMLGGVAMLGVVVVMAMLTSHTVKRQRQEQQRIEAIEELVQLRRWDQAAGMLESILSEPTRSPAARIQALIYLASVLGRYHRFDDAIAVQNYLLEHAEFDPGTTSGIKLMRAMSMLHVDHLVDADRAIGDLRRENADSAGLALVEMYRDVRTGHAAEAVRIFQDRLPAMRVQLAHRVADAYALAAKSYDILGQDAEAAAAWEKASLLSPVEELTRRYPELASLKDKYPGASMPREGA